MARYRAGDWKAALASLSETVRSPDGRGNGSGFFLAMAHWQLGEKEKARTGYDQAVQWMEKNQPQNEELRRFRTEAAELLGVREEVRSKDQAK